MLSYGMCRFVGQYHLQLIFRHAAELFRLADVSENCAHLNSSAALHGWYQSVSLSSQPQCGVRACHDLQQWSRGVLVMQGLTGLLVGSFKASRCS